MSKQTAEEKSMDKLYDSAIDWMLDELDPLIDKKEDELNAATGNKHVDSFSLHLEVLINVGVTLAYMGWSAEELCEMLTERIEDQMSWEEETQRKMGMQ